MKSWLKGLGSILLGTRRRQVVTALVTVALIAGGVPPQLATTAGNTAGAVVDHIATEKGHADE